MNHVHAMKVYRRNDVWVQDDPLMGPVPFAPPGMQRMIDRAARHLPDADERGFTAVFSDRPFPGAQIVLQRLHPEGTGHWYRWTETGMTGWLGDDIEPFFWHPPKRVYIGVSPDEGKRSPVPTFR
jgi:hypothetical protein